MTKVVDDDRARQATPGRPILYVLIASLALVGVYMIAMTTWSGTTSPASDRPAVTGSTSPSKAPDVPATTPAAPTQAAPTSNPPVNPQGGSPAR